MKKNQHSTSLSKLLLIALIALSSVKVQAQDPFIAEIRMFAGNFAPRGWAFCEGQLMAINSNQALFALIGTTYGGNGITTFALPDLRGRAPVHQGQGPGLRSYVLGEKAGNENVTLSTAQMPVHTHAATLSNGTATIKASSTVGTSSIPGQGGASTIAATGTGRTGGSAIYNSSTPDITLKTGDTQTNVTGTVTLSPTGQSLPVSIVQPVLGINYIICLQGIFPSRN